MKSNLTIPAGSSAIVALSGGVDSAVTAALLLEQGVKVVAATMLHKKTGQEQDLADAEAICKILDIPYFGVPLADQYEDFLENEVRTIYAKGQTPNPCVLCNEQIKFNLFFNTVIENYLPVGFDRNCYWASGHYARVIEEDGTFYVAKAPYSEKDQSYFLYRLSQNVLKRLRFPLGLMIKKDVRALAAKFNLPVKAKADSQDFCLGEIELRPKNEEKVTLINKEGKKLGEGRGFSHYTIGQRKGLGVASLEPLYVNKINEKERTVVLGTNEDLFEKKFTLSNVVMAKQESLPFESYVKVRSASKAKWGSIAKDEQGQFSVTLSEAERAISPGQSAVFYKDDKVLGGGYINRVEA